MSNPILSGKSDKEGVVGLHPHKDQMRVFTTDYVDLMEFYPFVHVSDVVAGEIENGFNLAAFRELGGSGKYNHLAVCQDISQFYDVKSWLYEHFKAEEAYIEHSLVDQFLQQTGITLFEGLDMADVHRLALDIEVYSKDGFPDASRDSDEIIIISLADNRGYTKLLHTANVNIEGGMQLKDEPSLLQQLIRVIHRLDPDVIEGHNILGFDLPYLRDRFEKYGIKFGIGRDNSEPRYWESEKEFAEREVEYENFVIAGRSVVDSYFLAADYDTYARDLPSYGLKDIAKHFGIVAEDREYVEGHRISDVWDKQPKRLLKYALDDAVETSEVVAQLGNASFALTKLVPMTWQEAIISGTASTLESIMVREYIRQRESLPDGDEQENFEGAFTEIFWRGVFDNCAYEDVSSLYPSIMLTWDVKPESDTLGVFQPMLDQLTTQRLKNKEKLTKLDSETQEYERVDAEQAAQKILINSAYGMLGFPFALFSDIQQAAFVTRKGREILKSMIRKTESQGARVVSCDTDGLLFEVPEDASEDEIIATVDDQMPKGINIDKDYVADRVVSYKSKNYAKLSNGELEISGASLMGRQKEPFLRSYIHEQLMNLAERDIEGLRETHIQYEQDIQNSNLTANQLCRRQRLKKTLEEYKRGIEENENKHPLAQYEVALRKWDITGIEPKKGDTVRYYVSYNPISSDVKVSRDARLLREYDGDEDREYYLDRLQTTAELFHPFLSSPDPVFSYDPAQTSLFGNDPIELVEIVQTQVNSLTDNGVG